MLIGLIPVFNEEESVTKVLNKIEKQVDYIVLVNDGSFDKTYFLISEWIKNRRNVQFISFQKNRGMSYALLQGFIYIFEQCKKGTFSREDVIVTIDADGQHDPEEVQSSYEYFNKNNLDVLIAQRDFSNYPKYRIFGNRLLSLIASCLGKFKFKDIECGFKMMKVAFVIDLLNYYIGYKYSCAGEIGIIASLLGCRIDNSYSIKIFHYRKKGPGLIDLFINLIFYFLVVAKIKMRKNRGPAFLTNNVH